MLAPYIAVSVLYALLILGVWTCGLSTRAIKVYLMCVSGLLVWTITLYLYFYVDLGTWLLFVGRLNFAMGIPAAGGSAAFFYYFPHPTRAPSKIAERWIFSLTGIFMLLIALTPLVDATETYTNSGPVFTPGKLYPVFLIYLIGSLVMSIVWGSQKLLTLTGLDRVRMRYVFWTFFPCSVLIIFFNVFLPYFDVLIWQSYSFVLVTPVALISFYVIYNYRLFNFSYLLLKVFRELLLALIFGGTILLGSELLGRINAVLWLNNLLSATFALFLLVFVNRIFPRLFTRDFREFRTQLQALRARLPLCESSQKLSELLEEIFVFRLNIVSAKIFIVTPTLTRSNLPIYPPDALTHILETKGKALLTAEILAREKNLPTLNLHEAVFFLPLLMERKLVGFLVLGQKSDRSAYSAEEITQLEKLQNELTICLTNILLTENILEENDLLKNIVAEKTKRLREQNKTIQQFVKKQSDFITLAAHELRAPLSVALLQFGEIEKNLHHLTPKVNSDLETITEALEKINRLIETIFDAQMLDLNKVHPASTCVKMKRFCLEFCHSLEPLAKQKGLHLKAELKWDDQFELEIDPLLIEQVLRNLIINAMRFSPSGGTITLRGGVFKKHPRLTIADEGPGIAPAALENIFKKFWRQTGRQEKGAGLGLYICKKIIELHGGKIWAENRPSGGAQISFEF